MTTDVQVPFFDYPALYRQHKDDFQMVINDVLSRGAYIMQADLAEFEASLAKYVGARYAVGTADGTMALLLSCIAAGIGEGDEVIVPSHTFVASASAIHHAGAEPVLCDCGVDHLIEPDSVRRLISEKTRAIMPVQLNGRTANMDPIIEIAREFNLRIIEDSCQALGSRYKGKSAGTFGCAGAFSFFPAKTLGAFGDAGGVVTDDPTIAKAITILRDHGRNPDDDGVSAFGFNARLDNVQAAILNYRLKRYEEYVEQRREIARIYQEALAEIDDLVLPPGPDEDDVHFDVYQNYEIESSDRDALAKFLERCGIGTRLQWNGKCVHQLSELDLRFDCPNTEKLTERFLMIPMNSVMSSEDAHRVSSAIRKFYGLADA